MQVLSPRPTAHYAKELRAALPKEAFAPRPARVLWLFVHAGLIAAAAWIISAGWGGWPLALALSLVIGNSFASLAFVGHETLHGAVVRGRTARFLVGWLAFLPFVLSPRLWMAWHNRIHHGHTADDRVDPDTCPTLKTYEGNRFTRFKDRLAFGERRWWGALILLVAFTVQCQQVLWHASPRFMSPRQRGLAILETFAGVAVWTALAVALGPGSFLFVFVLPLLLANLIVIGYIATNHGLSPLTEVNDPLLNSLSVTTPRLFNFLHLGFGYHVEHHIFPAMSSAHAPAVRRLLLERWPELYQTMPLHRALHRLFISPRVYKDATTLVGPRSGAEVATLLPHPLPLPLPLPLPQIA